MLYFLIASNLLMILMFLLKFNHLPPQIPLFYSKPWGEDQLVEYWIIFILPVLLNFFFFLNRFIYKIFFVDDLVVKKIITYLNLFLIISITLVFLKIILLIS